MIYHIVTIDAKSTHHESSVASFSDAVTLAKEHSYVFPDHDAFVYGQGDFICVYRGGVCRKVNG